MTSVSLHAPVLPLPPAFDPARARHMLEDLGSSAATDDSGFRALLSAAAGNSPYLARIMLREPGFLSQLLAEGPDACLAALDSEALAIASESDLPAAMRRLRVARRRVALAVALADVAGLYGLGEVTGALARFADASVKGALRFLLRQAAEGTPLAGTSPEQLEAGCGLFVLAMGKHGARELNYSSDIDLVIFYDEERFPFAVRGEKARAAIDLVKGLVKLLAEVTADGYVFRVDLRLRPDAGATQIAVTTAAAEIYYESMGQNWERAAMIKARPCAGDAQAAQDFLKNVITPFVWRKHLDYAAIEDIHSIKRQIHSHGGHDRVAVLGHNIKLGRGGIREIEFFAQTQQLILGGRDASLRERPTLSTLAGLKARGLISAEAEQELAGAYQFLRMLEHRLQMIDDQQTHTLPKTPDGLDHVARFCGFADTHAFEDVLLGHLNRVVANYARLFEQEAPLAARSGSLVFTGVEDDPETIATLSGMGFRSPSDVAAVIRGWHHGRVRAMRSARARELLTKLMPALLEALARTADPQSAFLHFDRLLSGLPAGVQVFSLLAAKPELLKLIAEIAGSAPRLADYLGRNPAVLDVLIDPDFLARIPAAEELRLRFEVELARLPGYEGALNAARRFAREEIFRIGVHVIEHMADAETAGPSYAAVAETVIAGLQPVVEEELIAAHGRVPGGGFAVVAQGKLGGREMTAGSDLDLVFLYTHAPDAQNSDGPKPLAVSQYFARAAQRFIAALTALTAEGRLYEVDMRLRPSGNQGPVAVRLDSFADYHQTKSWTWERLALTRARVLSGPPSLRRDADAIIRASLARPVDCALIRRDARDMRDRLAAQFPPHDPWDIKFALGGLVDIEFIAQALQLCHAADADVLDQNTVAALEKIGRAGVLPEGDVATLIEAARLQHALTQVLRIALETGFKPEQASLGLKALLVRSAHATSFAALEAQLQNAQQRARAIFERILPPA
jgi:glutamate-ammonia-ligase adenylyltransferase